jgi:carboxypeptidase C (cathepsin A)
MNFSSKRLSPVLILACLTAAWGQSPANDGPVAKHHQVVIGGKTLQYTSKAGLLPIRDNDTGDVHANMFYIAYTLDRPSGSPPRPLTFLWNGGPGSNSGLVHLLGFGPKRIALATGSAQRLSPAGTTLVDNQDTWLAFTDLVFIDPIGTGYSRPTKPEYGAEFYQGRGDAESVAEFIRVYRLRNNAYDSPLYLLGESYGVTRCALVAEALERRHTTITGVVMLSGGFPPADIGAGQATSLALPTYTAAAYYNKKLPADMQSKDIQTVLRSAEAYAKGEYAAALAKGDSLTGAERDTVAAQLARFSGLPLSQIDKAKLRISMEQFSLALLEDKKLMVGHYDSRIVGPRDPSPQYDPTTDPSLKDILDGISVIRYLRNELDYQSDLAYQGPFGGGYPPPTSFRGDWMSVRWNRTGPQPSPGDNFRTAMAANPRLRVMVVSGIYDLVSNYLAIEQAAAKLPADLSKRVTIRTYAGGHAIYTDDAVRHQLRTDAATFFGAAQ